MRSYRKLPGTKTKFKINLKHSTRANGWLATTRSTTPTTSRYTTSPSSRTSSIVTLMSAFSVIFSCQGPVTKFIFSLRFCFRGIRELRVCTLYKREKKIGNEYEIWDYILVSDSHRSLPTSMAGCVCVYVYLSLVYINIKSKKNY